uniref:Fibrinogen C-terminal domain-containing protein n=1 Tax=Magallana gigas TaxID=29159 RepID=A0A8W8P0H5_MAGGI
MTSTEDGWRYYQISAPPDCHGVMETGESTSGLYVIDPFGDRQQPVTVYCDMDTDNGGWTAIQRRLRGTMKFDKTWTEFKNGFGDPPNAYWIGDSMINTGFSRVDLNGTSFSTVDRDNDQDSGNCAASFNGGWWHNACNDAFLNGPWSPENGPWPPESWCPWFSTITTDSNIAEVRLMIKPT